MASLPRILTVDPTWTIARILRSAIDLTDRTVIQVDVPGGDEALQEITQGQYMAVVTTLQTDGTMKGFELALRVRQSSPHTAVIILADSDDSEELDAETLAESPFIYMRRPVDVPRFMRVLLAALDGEDVFAAYADRATSALAPADMGAVPALDPHVARNIVDALLTDVGAMAIVLHSRAGEILVENGAVGYFDRERLTQALLPTVSTNVAMGDLVGGQHEMLQFFDGEAYDIFVLAVGYHHYLSLVFDGQAGARQFGAVARFGRRAAADLKALLGASAYTLQAPAPPSDTARRKPARPQPAEEEDTFEPLARAEGFGDGDEPDETAAAPVEEDRLQLDPIQDFDPSILDQLGDIDISDADNLFDPDKLEEIAKEARKERGSMTYEEAVQVGLIRQN